MGYSRLHKNRTRWSASPFASRLPSTCPSSRTARRKGVNRDDRNTEYGERCPPRRKSKVERLTAEVKPLLASVTVDYINTKKVVRDCRNTKHRPRLQKYQSSGKLKWTNKLCFVAEPPRTGQEIHRDNLTPRRTAYRRVLWGIHWLFTKSLPTFGVWDGRFREKRQQLQQKKKEKRLLESHSQNLSLTVLYVPNSLDGRANCSLFFITLEPRVKCYTRP